MAVEIRRATRKDAPTVQHLNRCFNGVDTSLAWVERALARRAGTETVLLAWAGVHAVGFGCLRLSHSACYVAPVGEITELFVLPEWRRRGIGRQLVACLIKTAQGRGVIDLSVVTGARNAAAMALYAASHLAVSGDVVWRLKPAVDVPGVTPAV